MPTLDDDGIRMWMTDGNENDDGTGMWMIDEDENENDDGMGMWMLDEDDILSRDKVMLVNGAHLENKGTFQSV